MLDGQYGQYLNMAISYRHFSGGDLLFVDVEVDAADAGSKIVVGIIVLSCWGSH